MKVILNFSDLEIKILGNDLLDIQNWFEKAKDGKINNCKKRLIREWHPKLMADPGVDTIPANEEEFINFVTSRPDYKDRVEREKMEEEKIIKEKI